MPLRQVQVQQQASVSQRANVSLLEDALAGCENCSFKSDAPASQHVEPQVRPLQLPVDDLT
jgi:hypothetical protein